ncbi:MAG: HD domain-containing protein [Blautia sp.]|nr:HD domain-containing protein [Blautia sp.]
MSRIKDLQKQVHKILKCMEDNQKHAGAIAHLHGVSLAAVMIAKKRGENPELAAMAGLLHDLYAYKSGSYDDHAHKGADYARRVLDDLGIVNQEETDIICSAVRHHDSKDRIDSPMDEVLKDADVIHHSLGDPTKEVKEHEKARFEKLCEEFGFSI